MDLTHVEIKIQSLEDKDKVAFPELNEKEAQGKLKYAQINKVLVMEGATKNGKAAVHITGETEDGEILVLQTSALILDGIRSAAVGAAKRWGQDDF